MAERFQLRRTKGWRMPPNTVSVARPGPYGNPMRVGWLDIDQTFCGLDGMPGKVYIDAGNAVAIFEFWMGGENFAHMPAERPDLTRLVGKNLACWCPLDKPCHADVLLELANRDSDGTATAAANEDLPVPKDCQARAESIAQSIDNPTLSHSLKRQ